MTALLTAAAICLLSPNGSNMMITSDVQVSETVPESGSIQWTLTGSVRILDEDEHYRHGGLDSPSYVFLEAENFNTFALVWLPEDWTDLPDNEKEAIVLLSRHHEQASHNFSKWQILASRSNRAVIAPQIWLNSTEVPGGYIPDPVGGYNLDLTRDVIPAVQSLTEYYGISSVQMYGG